MAFRESATFEYLIKTKSIVNELEKYSWFVNKMSNLSVARLLSSENAILFETMGFHPALHNIRSRRVTSRKIYPRFNCESVCKRI